MPIIPLLLLRWKLHCVQVDLESAPILDGFSGKYFNACSDMVNLDISSVVMHFFQTRRFHYDVNANFMLLIPKIDDLLSIDQYQSIFLGNFLYKIIAKILGNRLFWSGF